VAPSQIRGTGEMTEAKSEAWLAFDIGGANLKGAHSSGRAASLPFEVWKRPDDLAEGLGELASALPPADGWAVTMTAELCDCFATKADGVRSILAAATRAAGGRPIRVWGVDGRFHEVASILERPRLAAASNWLALATVVARSGFGESGLLVDVGSTTTDLIPWRASEVAIPPEARTDLGRLQSGALVYAGVRRTPICALAPSLPYRGADTPLMAELFATTLDVYLTLGDLPAAPEDRSTGDGGPSTPGAALDRLARMIGLDRDDFTPADALTLAQAADKALVDRLIAAADRVVADALREGPASVVIAGSGEFLARKLADRISPLGGSVVSLAQAWGEPASNAACARALIQLVESEARTP